MKCKKEKYNTLIGRCVWFLNDENHPRCGWINHVIYDDTRNDGIATIKQVCNINGILQDDNCKMEICRYLKYVYNSLDELYDTKVNDTISKETQGIAEELKNKIRDQIFHMAESTLRLRVELFEYHVNRDRTSQINEWSVICKLEDHIMGIVEDVIDEEMKKIK